MLGMNTSHCHGESDLLAKNSSCSVHSGNGSQINFLTEESLQSIRTVICAVYMVICVLGFTGNMVLLGIMKSVKTLSVTDLYIVNLAVSDVFILTTLPLAAADMLAGNHWPFDWSSCKFMVCAVYANICAGVWTVTAMTYDRFQCIVFAIKMRGRRTKQRAKKIIGFVWFISVIYTLPVVYFSDKSEGICTLHYVEIGSLTVNTVMKMHMTFRFTVAFVMPLTILIICNTAVVCFMRGKDRRFKQKGQKRRLQTTEKVTRIVTMVTFAFLVCWLPNFVSTLIFVISPSVLGGIGSMNQHMYMLAHWLTVCLLYFNSCLNPLMYALLGGNYRKTLVRLARVAWNKMLETFTMTSTCRRRPSQTLTLQELISNTIGVFQDHLLNDQADRNRVIEINPQLQEPLDPPEERVSCVENNASRV